MTDEITNTVAPVTEEETTPETAPEVETSTEGVAEVTPSDVTTEEEVVVEAGI